MARSLDYSKLQRFAKAWMQVAFVIGIAVVFGFIKSAKLDLALWAGGVSAVVIAVGGLLYLLGGSPHALPPSISPPLPRDRKRAVLEAWSHWPGRTARPTAEQVREFHGWLCVHWPELIGYGTDEIGWADMQRWIREQSP
jgi:hypothetical protein